MKSCIDHILKEIGLETPDLVPINKREAFEMGLIKGHEKPKKCEGCGKSAYTSASKCDAAIKHRLEQGFGGTGMLRAYECDIIKGNWHMSSVNNKKKL
jgi:hypothetical protein